jgi:prepilin-type N-terminal cleavage/methylation domain-containing protein
MYIIRPLKSPYINTRGFTLVEMAVVLVILALLLGGLLIPLSAQRDMSAYNETRQKIAVIKEAILGFVVANGRFPCPANPALASSAAGAGTELCTLSAGVVPWADLGVPELDAWNGRFSYVVSPSFKDAISANTVTPPASCTSIPTASSFALCSYGTLNVNNSDGVSVVTKAPVTLISHGKNGLGAYRSDGSQFSATGATAQELGNLDGTSPFIYSEITQNGYDDFVDWVSINVLFNRMVVAGKLP